MTKNARVVVAMSGGVDSSVTAYLLKQQGYEVIGATMQIWQDRDPDEQFNEGGCCSLSAVNDARRVADLLNIPYYVFNLKLPFKEKVMDYFIDEYLKGRTPNPCIACNRYIKFEDFLNRVLALDAQYMATGHYARISFDKIRERYIIRKAIDQKKDQTYVLYNLTQFQLKHTLMPLGEYTKDQVRAIAKEIGLAVADKPDSQEICFIPKNDYKQFLKEKVPNKIKPGPFLDTEGNKIGEHKGLAYYTVGQRKGLGLAMGKPVYVVDLDAENNAVIIGNEYEVLGKELLASELNFIPFDKLEKPMKVTAKIRYTAPEKEAIIIPERADSIRLIFNKPERAITPGQSVVFYDGDLLIGGGIIKKCIKKYPT